MVSFEGAVNVYGAQAAPQDSEVKIPVDGPRHHNNVIKLCSYTFYLTLNRGFIVYNKSY